MPENAPWFALGIALAALLLLLPLRLMMKRRRLLTDMPTSKAAGVTLGLAELKGRAEEMVPLHSFLAEAKVVHYAYEVEEHWRRTVTERVTDSKGNTTTRTRTESGWRTVAEGGETVPFWLRDDTGCIRILPDGAKIEPTTVFSRCCTPSDPLYYGKGPSGSVLDSTHERRFTERAVPTGATLFLVGQVRARQDVAEPEVASDQEAEMFLVSMRTEEEVVRGYGWLTAFWGLLGFLVAAAVPLPFAAGRNLDFGGMLARQAGWIALAVFLHFLCILGLYAAGLFNGLVRLRERVRRAEAMVEVELQRRAELIPRLAETVKAYAAHERGTLEALARVRATATAVHDAGEAAAAQADAVGRLIAVSERYPALKADSLFRQLSDELTRTEERLALGRSFFNASVELHNARLLRFPDQLFASLGGFALAKYLEAAEEERRSVAVMA